MYITIKFRYHVRNPHDWKNFYHRRQARKFGAFLAAQRNELTPADILLIAGDAGYVWREHDSSPLTTLQQLFPGTVAFVDGNHENHALLNSMEVQLWNGGRSTVWMSGCTI